MAQITLVAGAIPRGAICQLLDILLMPFDLLLGDDAGGVETLNDTSD